MRIARALLVVVAATAASLPARGWAKEELGQHMKILGVTLEKTTLQKAQRILGPAEVRHNGGDAAASASAECFVGSDGTTLALISNSEMGGGTTITEYQLVAQGSLADFSGAEPGTGYAVPPDHQPHCLSLAKLSRSTATTGGLRLGMTEDQVRRLLGQPAQSGEGYLLFTSEAKLAMTPEQRRAFEVSNGRGQTEDYLMRGRGIRVEFQGKRAAAIRVWQVTSR